MLSVANIIKNFSALPTIPLIALPTQPNTHYWGTAGLDRPRSQGNNVSSQLHNSVRICESTIAVAVGGLRVQITRQEKDNPVHTTETGLTTRAARDAPVVEMLPRQAFRRDKLHD